MFNKLPINERSFTIDIQGSETKLNYKGEFTVRCKPTVKERQQIDFNKNKLREGITGTIDYDLAMANFILASLSVRIISAPDWWKETKNGEELLDENVVAYVFTKMQEKEQEWEDDIAKLGEQKEGK